jgi:hypothetical protein
MSTWLVEKMSGLLGDHTGRRDFLQRSAIVGSAMTVAPASFVLKPGTAYGAVCSCNGSLCGCGDLCCDGYTEFCCTIYGENKCPPGTMTAGWWKSDGSGFCNSGGADQPRYYVDCNAECGACGPDGSGFCSGACFGCGCGCTGGDCGRRKTCCTKFRYGQCNQAVPFLGPIVCRVITCSPPWLWESTCTTSSATDNHTRFHDAPCLHGSDPLDPVVSPWAIGIVRGKDWMLQNQFAGGSADKVVSFGRSGDVPLVGDWNGDGQRTIGIWRAGRFYLKNSIAGGAADTEFTYGLSTDTPIVGDWNGDGRTTIGIVRGNTFHLRNSNTGGAANTTFSYGLPSDTPIVGDWNGDGRTTIGVRRGKVFYLRNSNTGGVANIEFSFGLATDVPIVGDWNGDGTSNVGVRRGATWYLRYKHQGGGADAEFSYGIPSDLPVVFRG